MTRSCTMGGGSIGRRSAGGGFDYSERTPMNGVERRKKRKREEKRYKIKHGNTRNAERRTTNTTHPGLLRLLPNEKVVFTGPVHRCVRGGEGSKDGIFEGGGEGKGT